MNAIFSEHIPLEFWKSVHQISSFSRKPGFWRPFWFFPSKPEVDSENRNFIHVHATDSDHMPLEFRKSVHYISSYLRKCCLRQPFWIFLTKPEVDFKNQRWCALFCTKPELLAFKFWKSVHWLSSYVETTLWHTDRQTDRHTYTQTDRRNQNMI